MVVIVRFWNSTFCWRPSGLKEDKRSCMAFQDSLGKEILMVRVGFGRLAKKSLSRGLDTIVFGVYAVDGIDQSEGGAHCTRQKRLWLRGYLLKAKVGGDRRCYLQIGPV